MDEKYIINSAVQFIESLFAEDHSGHDAEHSLRVYNTALSIADTEPQCSRLVVSLAALLHDADDHKLFCTENNRNARAFLEEHQVNNELIEQICEVINSVSFSKNKGLCPKSIESKVVQDANRLDAKSKGRLRIIWNYSKKDAHHNWYTSFFCCEHKQKRPGKAPGHVVQV